MADEAIVGKTRGGTDWIPEFVTALNPNTCIGCGRCYKVCPRDVFELVDRADVLGADAMDDEDYDDDDELKVMAIKDAMDCIGCKACSRVCPKDCHTHEAAA